MIYLVSISYQLQNDLNFNHLIYPKLKANLWLNHLQQYPFAIEKILNLQGYIMPNAQAEIIIRTNSNEHLQIDEIYE